MNPVVVIPTFIYPRRHRGGADVVSTYDHPTAPNQEGARPLPGVAGEGGGPGTRGHPRVRRRVVGSAGGREGAGHRQPPSGCDHARHRRGGAGAYRAAHGPAEHRAPLQGDRPARLRRHPELGAARGQRARLRRRGVFGRRRGDRRSEIPREGHVRPREAHAPGRAHRGEDGVLFERPRLLPLEMGGQVVQPLLAAGPRLQRVDHQGHARPALVALEPCVRRLLGRPQGGVPAPRL